MAMRNTDLAADIAAKVVGKYISELASLGYVVPPRCHGTLLDVIYWLTMTESSYSPSAAKEAKL